MEVNPGPRNWKYPCGVCAKPVKSNQRGVQCDVCTMWLHTRCIGISNEEYAELQGSDESWCCKKCLTEALPLHDVSDTDSIFDAPADSTVNTSQDSSLTPTSANGHKENRQQQSPSPPKSLSILYTNCRSLLPKLDHLRLLACTQTPHIIAITETWLDTTISNSEAMIPGYQVVRRDRDRHGGGIALYIRDHLHVDVLLSHNSAELLIVELPLRSSKVVCGLLYRPPSADASLLSDVESALEQLSPSRLKSLILLGDFNIDRSPTSSHPLLPILNSIEDKLDLKQVVTTATCTTSTSSTIIDHIYISNNITHSHCTDLPPLLGSDHNILQISLANNSVPHPKRSRRKVWLYKQADFDTANATLQCLPTSMYSADDVNNFWAEWSDVFMTVIADTIPTKCIKPKSKVPYLTDDLIHLVRKKCRLFRLAKRVGTAKAWAKYTKLRNRVTSALRSAKKIYFNQLARNLRTPRDFWSQLHKLNPKHTRTPASLNHSGTKASTPTKKANLLNNFFTSCFTKNDALPHINFPSPPSPMLSTVTCSHDEVLKLLSTHKINTASGPDGISSIMLRGTATSITPALTALFNLSLKKSTVPDDWKRSNITPIFKSGDPSEASNYRPISLLSLISKILERCIHNRIMDFLLRNNLLSDCQFGFRPRSSTQDALLTITRDWHQSLSTNRQVAAVFFDIKKAFDSVPHNHLLQSLANIGITGQLHQWFASYLFGRYQRVALDGFSSSYQPVTSGVPQGSILGPLLYIIFMNSISKLTLSSGARLVLYADDILLYKPVNSEKDCDSLQNDVDSILQWIKSHGLRPNHSKTQLLTITRSRQPVPIHLKVEGHQIPPSQAVKYLGVTLSSRLTWSDHINSTCKAAKRQIGLIHRQFHQAPPEVRLKVINSTILPKLEYCAAVWDPHLKKDIANLDNVQKFAGRTVTRNWSMSKTELQSKLNWQPLQTRRRNIKLKIVYNITNKLSRLPPTVFINHPSPSPRHPHNKILFQPYVSTLSHRHSFFIDVIPIWNSLSSFVVNSPSPNVFKSRLRSHC